jgi:hypothetical protein
MGDDSFYSLVQDLVIRMLGDGKEVQIIKTKPFKSAKNKALEILLTHQHPDHRHHHHHHHQPQKLTSSSSLNLKALTDLFNKVSDISQRQIATQSLENVDEISAYQLVPIPPETSLFDRVSDLIEELDSIGEKPYENSTEENNICGKTILFLSNIAVTSSSSSFSKNNNNNTQQPPSLSQSFYCSDDLLNNAEKIFSSDPGWTFPGSKFFTESQTPSSDYSHDLSNSLFRALTRKPPPLPTRPFIPSSSSSPSRTNQNLFALDLQLPRLPIDPESFASDSSLLPFHLHQSPEEISFSSMILPTSNHL